MDFSVRAGTPADLPAIARIQGKSSWRPEEYLQYDLLVAETQNEVVAFLATRAVAGETEILNIVVEPAFRRLGIAETLLQHLAGNLFFLEVRESNFNARNLYQKLGFQQYGRRKNYYEDPSEDAVVMRLSSALKRVKT